jgi:NADH dehydrogenase [ubiquinone] 1 alpha subcomplex assembly factor 7
MAPDRHLLEKKIAERIRREGPIAFSDFQELALYDHEGGFFATGRGAGRAGRDFVTSAEIGPLFGVVVGRYLDEAWDRLERTDPFVVVEAGAGRGRLASSVLRSQPACAPCLRYVLVERSPTLRQEQRAALPIEPPDEALGPFMTGADPDDATEPVPGAGPIVTSIDDLPGIQVRGVVLANELLDNLPVRIVERADDGWLEVRVAVDDQGRFVEAVVPAVGELDAAADEVAAGTRVPHGARLPVPVALREWLTRAATVLAHGEIVLIDYVASVDELLARGQQAWMRTYRDHGRGTDPLDAPGSQDITSDVPLEYLRAAATRAGLSIATDVSQAEWLQSLGIDALVDEGTATWNERAHIGDLAAVEARSRAQEAAALVDPTGLGAHRVMTLRK